ncbi:MAG: hypothetical protein R2707_16305 [Acidimicrobiales bacterium]
METARADVAHRDSPPLRSTAFRLYLAAVFLMSLQLEVDAFKSVADTRFPPGDFLLLFSILLMPVAVRARRSPIALLPIAMVGVMAYGVLLAIVYAGSVSDSAIQVKLFGTITLAIWCLVTIYYVQQGQAWRILRTWTNGMIIWGAVSFVDWKFVDYVPGLEAKTPSRFGGMQFDPNNAGAAYAVVVLVLWRYGHRLYPSLLTRLVALALGCTFLGYTFSRGGLIGAVLSAVVVLVVSRDGVSRRARAVAAAFFVTGIAVLSGYAGEALDNYTVRPDTVSSRDAEAERGIQELTDSWGLGIGLGTHLENNPQIIHNTAIWLTVEMSVIGLGFFIALVAVPIVVTMRGRGRDPDLAMALLAGHLAMIAASIGIEAIMQRQWWLLVGLCASPSLLAPDDATELPQTATGERRILA